MHVNLSLHGRQINSIFELLGTKENDITYSLGWVMAHNEAFQRNLLQHIFNKLPLQPDDFQVKRILLQEYVKGSGITDVELQGKDFHIIIEAKRGWSLPTQEQLSLYAKRLHRNNKKHCVIVTMSECLASKLPNDIAGTPIHHIPWQKIAELAKIRQGTNAEKRLLRQFGIYLERIVKMQNQESNLVYVVSLSKKTPKGWNISFYDVVEKLNKYFHPIGNRYPANPTNYIGFHFDGKLQEIRHVESCKIFTDIINEISQIPETDWGEYYLYELGDKITPSKEVKLGRIPPQGRAWAMLDLLLTCDTISEAVEKTKARLAQDNEAKESV